MLIMLVACFTSYVLISFLRLTEELQILRDEKDKEVKALDSIYKNQLALIESQLRKAEDLEVETRMVCCVKSTKKLQSLF